MDGLGGEVIVRRMRSIAGMGFEWEMVLAMMSSIEGPSTTARLCSSGEVVTKVASLPPAYTALEGKRVGVGVYNGLTWSRSNSNSRITRLVKHGRCAAHQQVQYLF